MTKLEINSLRLRTLNELRKAVKDYGDGKNQFVVLEKIGKCLRVGANISMILVILDPILPKE